MTDSLPRRALGRVRRTLGSFGNRGTAVQRLRSELAAERERITCLESELDELRRDSLRVAELLDLAERHFSPGA